MRPPLAGLAVESFVIDSDHWRHYFLCMGVLWGVFIAARPPPRTASDGRPVAAFA